MKKLLKISPAVIFVTAVFFAWGTNHNTGVDTDSSFGEDSSFMPFRKESAYRKSAFYEFPTAENTGLSENYLIFPQKQ